MSWLQCPCGMPWPQALPNALNGSCPGCSAVGTTLKAGPAILGSSVCAARCALLKFRAKAAHALQAQPPDAENGIPNSVHCRSEKERTG